MAKATQEIEGVTIRFAGDSGDGIQLTGGQFTDATAFAGNDLSTLPDFPAEIRAPAGTLPGVSAFQIHFSSHEIMTPGDAPNVLVAMNPAALKVNLKDLEPGGILITNSDAFSALNLKKAGYEKSPLEDGSLQDYRLITIPLTTLTRNALEGLGLKPTEVERCKNFFALGVMFWLYERPLDSTLSWINSKFKKIPEIAEANRRALSAGHAYAETIELFEHHYHVKKAPIAPGKYRKITGNEATALGFVAAGQLAKRGVYYGSYPITPASDVLHELAKLKSFDVLTFQAEDEIAAIGASIGASFSGWLAVTGTSGPGVCLKSEAIGLAVSTELPLVILDVQRGGPSTGLPTKTEQADLLQALFGRNGECPVAIVAPATPAECFTMTIEACRIAMKHMTPVFILSDGYLGNGSEPWKIPQAAELPNLEFPNWTAKEGFAPFRRDPTTLARPWVLPGTPGLEHRIGGLEKQDGSGNVSYDPDNHEKMVKLRAEKVARIADDAPPTDVFGPKSADLLVVGWGSTYGAIRTAVMQAQKHGYSVAHAHLRHLNPFPKDLGEVLKRYKKVLVPELNLGQLSLLLRGKYLVDAQGLNKVKGQPFKVSEIRFKILEMLGVAPAEAAKASKAAAEPVEAEG
jgi:2-oxoglutarate/2-oxoacid ferredoxin oxidoreductase subunit alpha